MNQTSLQKRLASLPLGELRYFDSVGSTNDLALAWATEGAPDLSLILADEQTQGRGRAGRKWITPRGTALAFSLILRPALTPTPVSDRPTGRGESDLALRHSLRSQGNAPGLVSERPTGMGEAVSLLTGLGAVALVDALKKYGLAAQIKWPNDVLLNRKKCAGILVESVWTGEALDASVVGMGVNALAGAVPPAEDLLFPATSVEEALGRPADRLDLLYEILAALLARRPRLASPAGGELAEAWEEALAFKEEPVRVEGGSGETLEGRIAGLESDGALRLQTSRDKIVTVHFGEMRLRPAV
ncbi:MAG: biotin--[acetyl-CoA-carboxylase] ligase [Chloroflexota bacterium]